MSEITTHVLDVVLGKPAVGVAVRLDAHENGHWSVVANGATDEEGRCRSLTSSADAGIYRLTFATSDYLAAAGRRSTFPEVAIVFECDGAGHYHIPLLLSDHSYTTYRGS